MAGARKIDAHQVAAAISGLAEAGFVLEQPRVGLSEVGQARYHEIRAVLDDVTARANAELVPPGTAHRRQP